MSQPRLTAKTVTQMAGPSPNASYPEVSIGAGCLIHTRPSLNLSNTTSEQKQKNKMTARGFLTAVYPEGGPGSLPSTTNCWPNGEPDACPTQQSGPSNQAGDLFKVDHREGNKPTTRRSSKRYNSAGTRPASHVGVRHSGEPTNQIQALDSTPEPGPDIPEKYCPASLSTHSPRISSNQASIILPYSLNYRLNRSIESKD